MSQIFITITGLNYYLGKKPFKTGRIVRLEKEQNNEYDSEAIRVVLPYIDTVGYVANNPNTVFDGAFSAGRLYDKIGNHAFARVMFITHSSIIAEIIQGGTAEFDKMFPAENAENSSLDFSILF